MSHTSKAASRRTGDTKPITGNYQHRALTQGHPIQRAWHREKLELLDWFAPVSEGVRVLDVGCGSGVFAHAMAQRGADVIGIDANADAIKYAQSTFCRSNLQFKQGLVDELQPEIGQFDLVTCLEVIEHVFIEQVEALLVSVQRLLKPSGRFLVSTPNYRGVWPAVEWLMDRFSSAAHMDGEQHVCHFDRKRLRTTLERRGFQVTRLQTFSTITPFVTPYLASASERLSEGLKHVERRLDLPFGNILIALASQS